MPMPEYDPENPPMLGFFMVGAYQEILGNMHNLFYQGTYDLVRPVWDAFEEGLYAHQPAVEAAAMMLHQQGKQEEVAEFLTDYSYGTGLRALETGKQMLQNLWTRVSLINTPMSRRGYTDPRTWDDIGSLYMIH